MLNWGITIDIVIEGITDVGFKSYIYPVPSKYLIYGLLLRMSGGIGWYLVLANTQIPSIGIRDKKKKKSGIGASSHL